MTVSLRDALAYVLSRLGCVHPFLATRVLALAELYCLERRGLRVTDAVYRGGPGTFYVEGVKELVEGDECFYKREGDPASGVRGCIGYRCAEPSIGGAERECLDEALEASKNMDEFKLNEVVVKHSLFEKLVGSSGS